MDFIEVHTPILSNTAGGANAKPFITHHNDLDQNMFLRIAPELYLKRLVVGGLPRVYEIGPQFRNESIDLTHNPEFYSLEFYMAFADYYDLIEICENLLKSLIYNIIGNNKFTFDSREIDCSTPFNKIDIIEYLEKNIGEIPYDVKKDYSSELARNYFDNICIKHSIECVNPRTTSRLIDKLIGHYIEPQCINPTFVMNHPCVMSPLAKPHRDNPQLTERFELFINGMEIANAYTELNDPVIQRKRFMEQVEFKRSGDSEAQDIDEDFIEALEYGLPPTGGFGLGIERLVMLLTGKNNIKDVTTFPPITK